MNAGVINRTGMLIAMNNDCNGASIAKVALEPKPNNSMKNVPAHVGQPVKRPIVAPNPDNQFLLTFFGLFLYMNMDIVMFIPTSVDMINNRIRLIGIISMPNCSVIYPTNIGI